MSPILVRPVREQLEHDRIIRLLQSKNRRKFDVGINPGNEQNAAIGNGPATEFPDLVLHSLERGRRLLAVVEVETGESVNHLEALAEWAHFSKVRADFHLYVPAAMVDVARRLCEDNQIHVHEFWSYHSFGDEVRFNLVHRSKEEASARPSAPRPAAKAPAARAAAAPVKGKAAPAAAKRPSRAAKPVPRKAAPARAAKRPAKVTKPAKAGKSGKPAGASRRK